MEGSELFGELIKVFGGAGVSAGIMYLWIKHLISENIALKSDLKDSQNSRVQELKNFLPILTSASEGLQQVLADNKDRDIKLISGIALEIKKVLKDINIKCKG